MVNTWLSVLSACWQVKMNGSFETGVRTVKEQFETWMKAAAIAGLASLCVLTVAKAQTGQTGKPQPRAKPAPNMPAPTIKSLVLDSMKTGTQLNVPLPPQKPGAVGRKAPARAKKTLSYSEALAALKGVPAKKLFGRKNAPAALKPVAVGSYARGCLAGGAMLPVNGKAWQAMRLQRNRNWGHPALVAFVQKLARDVQQKDKWPGLLIGDMAQPRGGPMLTGHRSHQIGLDADIWMMPMPDRRLTVKERQTISAVSVLNKGHRTINRKVWKPGHVKVLKRAASAPEVSRIFVHPTIKKELCRSAGTDRAWLNKIRPWYGHHYHFHVRLACPAGSSECKNQAAPPKGDGCGKQLDHWFARLWPKPKPKKPGEIKKKPKPRKPRPPVTLFDLPPTCQVVLQAR